MFTMLLNGGYVLGCQWTEKSNEIKGACVYIAECRVYAYVVNYDIIFKSSRHFFMGIQDDFIPLIIVFKC